MEKEPKKAWLAYPAGDSLDIDFSTLCCIVFATDEAKAVHEVMKLAHKLPNQQLSIKEISDEDLMYINNQIEFLTMVRKTIRLKRKRCFGYESP